jgi:hypothetical protein
MLYYQTLHAMPSHLLFVATKCISKTHSYESMLKVYHPIQLLECLGNLLNKIIAQRIQFELAKLSLFGLGNILWMSFPGPTTIILGQSCPTRPWDLYLSFPSFPFVAPSLTSWSLYFVLGLWRFCFLSFASLVPNWK